MTSSYFMEYIGIKNGAKYVLFIPVINNIVGISL